MSAATATPQLAGRAVALRDAFDRVFATPVRADVAVAADLIAIRVGGEPCAIRLAEIAGLFADRKITPVPCGHPALVGLGGFRGALLPAYSLRILLGVSGTQPERWLVIAAATSVAFTFEAFEAHLRASADAIVPRQTSGPMQGFARAFMRSGEVVRPVLDLNAVIATLDGAPAPNLCSQGSKQ